MAAKNSLLPHDGYTNLDGVIEPLLSTTATHEVAIRPIDFSEMTVNTFSSSFSLSNWEVKLKAEEER